MKAIIYGWMLFCLNSAVYAGNESLPELARMEVARKLVAFSDSLGKCQKAEVPIAKSAFSSLNLTSAQLKTALKYHMLKANFECSKSEINDYLLSSSILAYMDSTARNSVLPGNELIIHDAAMMFKLRPEYMAIPAAQRTSGSDLDMMVYSSVLIAMNTSASATHRLFYGQSSTT